MTEEKAIHPDYQKYMDWCYWLKAYSHRSGGDEDREFMGLGSIFSSFENKTSEQIMDDVLSGKPLYVDCSLNATSSPILFDSAIIEPLLHSPNPFGKHDFADDFPTRENIRKILVDVEHAITALRVNETRCGRKQDDISAHKVEIVGIDYEKPKESILGEIEILWLEHNGLAREAYLRRIALLFGKKTIRSGPYVSRAIGLWLWDYKINGGRGMVQAFHQHYENNAVLSNYEEAELRFLYRITEECIKTQDVLPITKRKNREPKK